MDWFYFLSLPASDKQGRDKTDGGEDTRLDELTRSLQAATDSILEDRMTHSQQQQQQQSYQWQEQQQFSQQYQTVSSVAPPREEHHNLKPPEVRMPPARDPPRSASPPLWDNIYVCGVPGILGKCHQEETVQCIFREGKKTSVDLKKNEYNGHLAPTSSFCSQTFRKIVETTVSYNNKPPTFTDSNKRDIVAVLKSFWFWVSRVQVSKFQVDKNVNGYKFIKLSFCHNT